MKLSEEHIPALVSADSGLVVIPLDADPFVIGRKNGCNLQLADAKISREHAVIQSSQYGCQLLDRGSIHGTFVNGIGVTTVLLKHGDRLGFGVNFKYVYFDRFDPELFERVRKECVEEADGDSGEILMGLVNDYEVRPKQQCRVTFSLRCARDWATLSPTSLPTVRSCATCAKQVHYCSSLDELRLAVDDGQCVAFPAELAKEYRKR